MRTYAIWFSATIVFSIALLVGAALADTARVPAGLVIPNLIESSITPDGHQERQLFNHPQPMITALPEMPLVRAQGVFRAIVRPDALLLVVHLEWLTYQDSATAQAGIVAEQRDLMAALRATGVPSRDMMVAEAIGPTDERLFVRVAPITQQHLVEIAQFAKMFVAKRNDVFAIYFSIIPFVQDCNAMESAVERAALQEASLRAHAIAGAARMQLGDFIGAYDVSEYHDALCGYESDSTAEDLVRAMLRYRYRWNWGAIVDGNLHETGADASFSRIVRADWQLRARDTAGADWAGRIDGEATAVLQPTRVFVQRELHEGLFRGSYIRRSWAQVDSLALYAVGELNVTRIDKIQEARKALSLDKGPGFGTMLIDDNCSADDLSLLRKATVDAIKRIAPRSPYALVDDGRSIVSNICDPANDISDSLTNQINDNIKPDDRTITERVLVIPERESGP